MKTTNKKNSKERKKVKDMKNINRKHCIEVFCGNLLEAKKLQKYLIEIENDLKRKMVDKLMYKYENGKKERVDDDECHLDVVTGYGLPEELVIDIVDNMNY